MLLLAVLPILLFISQPLQEELVLNLNLEDFDTAWQQNTFVVKPDAIWKIS